MAEGEQRYASGEETPLAGYAALTAVFATGAGLFAVAAHRRGLRLPERVPPWDVVLLGTATFKASRLLTKDKVTSFLRAPFTRRQGEGNASEVMDAPRGTGLRRAVGDLVTCPFCTSAWVSGALVASYASAPRATRLLCAGLSAVTVSDWLQYAWSLTEQKAEEDEED
ncbi:DUF1360 domain-containing protein [Streptomyces sp. HMX87]|uniref:DUF1360 domain-containing protein n=1 Tax=Streptomyces sp. HMX87 TaxID=3390849 RepID=UPI003A8C853D